MENIAKLIRPVILNCFGGRCYVCGYDKFMEVLHLHHIDPDTKEHDFKPELYYNAELLRIELRKCMLVCSNCHMAIHAGLITVENKTYFDESKFILPELPLRPIKRTRLKSVVKQDIVRPVKPIETEHRNWLSILQNITSDSIKTPPKQL